MGLANLFRSQKNKIDKKKEAGEGRESVERLETPSVSGRSKCSQASGRQAVAKSRQNRKEDSIPSQILQKTSRNVQQVEAFVNFMNNFTTVGDLLSFFTPKGGLFIPEDIPPIPIEQFAELFQHIHESFPNINISYQSIQEDDEPNVVVVDKAQVSGTHTGTEYCPLPGEVPPVAMTGKHVVADEERWYFKFDPKENGRFESFSVYALGPITGPIGLYEGLQESIPKES